VVILSSSVVCGGVSLFSLPDIPRMDRAKSYAIINIGVCV
jgi:hypothetical protein